MSTEWEFLKWIGAVLLALAFAWVVWIEPNPIAKLKEFWDFWRGK